jgi:hypothetical protein
VPYLRSCVRAPAPALSCLKTCTHRWVRRPDGIWARPPGHRCMHALTHGAYVCATRDVTRRMRMRVVWLVMCVCVCVYVCGAAACRAPLHLPACSLACPAAPPTGELPNGPALEREKNARLPACLLRLHHRPPSAWQGGTAAPPNQPATPSCAAALPAAAVADESPALAVEI